MERRFSTRWEELLDDATGSPAVLRALLPRRERFVEPFAALLAVTEQRAPLQEYVAGLVSNVQRKNAESIAYHPDPDRQLRQKFIGPWPWDHQPHLRELARPVGVASGAADGVLVFDPAGFPKQGLESGGGQRQGCGRLGQVDNCQVGVYLGYVAHGEHARGTVRLSLPAEWAKDNKRRKKCGVLQEMRFKTRHELALARLREHGALLPHAWITGADERGRSSTCRGAGRALQERYLLAGPSNTLRRDGEAAVPPSSGHGQPPTVPFQRVERWTAALPASAWQTIAVRPGDNGPLLVPLVQRRVVAKTERRRVGPEEMVVVIREQQADGSFQQDSYLAKAAAATPLLELGRVAQAEHRKEECLERAKSETGLAE